MAVSKSNGFKAYILGIFCILITTIMVVLTLFLHPPVTTTSRIADAALTGLLLYGYTATVVGGRIFVRSLPDIQQWTPQWLLDPVYVKSVLVNFNSALFILTVLDFVGLWVPRP